MMASHNSISHTGRIVEVTPEFTTVEIISESACSACHASSLCGLSEYTRKAVQVPTRGWDDYKAGDEVNVVLKASMGHKAVWLAYVIPLVVLVTVLMVSLAAGLGELFSALLALTCTVLYYFVIYLCRERLRNEYVFHIEKKLD